MWSCVHAAGRRHGRCLRCSDGVESGHDRRSRHLAGGNNAGLGGGEWGGVHDAAGRPDQGDGMDPVELGGDAVPGPPGASFGDPDQQQGEPAEQHVGADAGFEAVEHRP